MTMITIDQALQSVKNVKSANLTALEAQLLLLHALGRNTQDRAWLLAHGDESLSPQTLATFQSGVQKRIDHVPLSYVLGQKEFYGLSLQVDPRVLDPRPDTETLVDWALSFLKDPPITPGKEGQQVLDLGTGSGAIALAIKANAVHCSIFAADNSQEALDVAQSNAVNLGLSIHLVKSNWFEAWRDPAPQRHSLDLNLEKNANLALGPSLPERFDLIVSNPPYIAPNDPHLKHLVHEPLQALVAQEEGMSDLRCIVHQATNHLKPGAWLLLEHGYDQSQAVREMLLGAGYENAQSRSDLAGIERCTGAQWPKMK